MFVYATSTSLCSSWLVKAARWPQQVLQCASASSKVLQPSTSLKSVLVVLVVMRGGSAAPLAAGGGASTECC